MTEDLRQYLKIDKHQLDEELVQQASLFYRVSEAYVTAAGERDCAKETLACVAATAEMEIRKKLGKEATEGKVKAMLALDKVYNAANGDYLDAKYKADQCQALKEAFHQRGYMLRDLAQLYVSNYYSTDSVRTTPEQNAAVYKQRRNAR